MINRVLRALISAWASAENLFFPVWLRLSSWPNRLVNKPSIPVIVGITSYPARINSAWISIETILRQSVAPTRFLLVLSREEFPGGVVPQSISARLTRGLDILWVEKNGRSFDKLLPISSEFPDEPIITVDDDKIFPRHLLRDLYREHQKSPSAVIGARGWVMQNSFTSGELHYGKDWVRAAPGATGRHLFMPGGNGCLYPPISLDTTVQDLDLALRLCPTADDIWFWASLQRTDTESICLGMPAHRPVSQQKNTSALSDVNESDNDRQFQSVISHFNLTVDLVPKNGN